VGGQAEERGEQRGAVARDLARPAGAAPLSRADGRGWDAQRRHASRRTRQSNQPTRQSNQPTRQSGNLGEPVAEQKGKMQHEGLEPAGARHARRARRARLRVRGVARVGKRADRGEQRRRDAAALPRGCEPRVGENARQRRRAAEDLCAEAAA